MFHIPRVNTNESIAKEKQAKRGSQIIEQKITQLHHLINLTKLILYLIAVLS